MKIICIAGARPNFMKIAPIMAALTESAVIDAMLVHTGQHYDRRMSELFFSELGIPEPDMNLEVGSGSHAVQTAEIMTRFEQVMKDRRPDAVLVVGDVNSTVGCGLTAVKLGAMLMHVEAGLRSFDRAMPEEINRVVTDSISDMLFCSEQSGVDNLLNEGVPAEKIHLVGNVMIDTLLKNREKSESSSVLDDNGLSDGSYATVTLHRPSNVDDPLVLSGLLRVLATVASDMPVVFPAHPRTRQRLADLEGRLPDGIHLVDPMGYLDFLKLTAHSRIVMTDSGGIQEETTILGVPCLTLRENTERPATVDMGTNQVVGTSPETILSAYSRVMSGGIKNDRRPPLWDGKAAQRITEILVGLC